MTLAPELPGALELIDWLVARDVVVSCGHSDADAAQAHAAFDRGARAITHVHNAHRRWRPRDPGIAGAALVRPDVTVQAIVDGVHLAPETAYGAFLAARERFCLVTDAIEAALLDPGEYELGGRPVRSRDGAVRLPDGTLAGSVLTMDEAVRNLVASGADWTRRGARRVDRPGAPARTRRPRPPRAGRARTRDRPRRRPERPPHAGERPRGAERLRLTARRRGSGLLPRLAQRDLVAVARVERDRVEDGNAVAVARDGVEAKPGRALRHPEQRRLVRLDGRPPRRAAPRRRARRRTDPRARRRATRPRSRSRRCPRSARAAGTPARPPSGARRRCARGRAGSTCRRPSPRACRARKPSASTSSLEMTVEPGTCPRASMSSVNEVSAPACAIRGSATKVPRPWSRYTEPSAVSRSISPRTVMRASP